MPPEVQQRETAQSDQSSFTAVLLKGATAIGAFTGAAVGIVEFLKLGRPVILLFLYALALFGSGYGAYHAKKTFRKGMLWIAFGALLLPVALVLLVYLAIELWAVSG